METITNNTTPTKKRKRPDSSLSPRSSPKFLKPSELFRQRLQQRQRQKTFSPTKPTATAALRRCKLPIETVEKIYSPLKCLQQQQQSSTTTGDSQSIDSKLKSPKCKTTLSFSPLMKKLQRSPGRSQISFPVVKRSLQKSSGNHAKQQQSSPPLTRVLDFNENAQHAASFHHDQNDDQQQQQHEFYPLCSPQIDWSLKTRMKIVINRTIPFNGTFNSVDEANGVNQFVRGRLGDDDEQIEANFCSQLQRHCLVWQHPHLAWMRLFPREPESKPGTRVSSMKPPMFQISPSGSMADSLYSDFCSALHSLFKLLYTKYCPYFYLCANNFTILFRASGVADSTDAHALITPTTIGFRRLLESECIQFDMPFYYQQSSTIINNESIDDNNIIDNDNDKNDDVDDEESSNLLLESLGLSQQDFPSLETSSLRRRRMFTENGKNKKKHQMNNNENDAMGKVRSLIRVNGITQLQSLIGLFINQRKICVSTSGPLAGIPPTILSPVAFHGATLRKLMIQRKNVTLNDNNKKIITTLDLNGAILPNTIYGLKLLLRRLLLPTTTTAEQDKNCQQKNQKMTVIRSTLRTYDQSASFALEPGTIMTESNNNVTFSVENLLESGMDRDFLAAICSKQRQHQRPINDFELQFIQGIRYNRFVSATAASSVVNKIKPMLAS